MSAYGRYLPPLERYLAMSKNQEENPTPGNATGLEHATSVEVTQVV
jgi:hypothetical protein